LPSTEDYDRGRKFNYYRACPIIQEYILVNTDFPGIEVCRREQFDLWSFHTFHANDELTIPSIDMRFLVAAAYEDVEFP
jgi:Uma2 family endonuclease